MMSASLGFEIRIVAGHIPLQTMRLQSGLFPHPMHSILADAQHGSELTTAPVRGTILGSLAGGCKNPGSQLRSQQ